MPRVHHVQKAQKDNPAVKKGEPYYWWKPYRSGRRYSATPPTRQQLTTSAFLADLYDVEDAIQGITHPEELDNFLMIIDEMREQCQDSLSNMPEHLQETSDSGMLLQERIDGLEAWHNELDAIDLEIDDNLSADKHGDRLQEILEEIQDTTHSL